MTQQLLEPQTSPTGGVSRWKTPIRIVAGVTATVVLLGGTSSAVAYFMLETSTQTKSFTNPLTKLKVANDTGDIVIRAGAAGEPATVISRSESSFSKPKHSEIVTDGVLVVSGSCGGGLSFVNTCEVDFDIVVPPGTAVEADTSTGDVSVNNTGGPVALESSTGDISVSRVGKGGTSIQLTTSVGDITGEFLNGGSVTSRSNTGDVELDFTAAPDRIKADTDTGDIEVSVPDDATAYRVDADVDTGDQNIDVPTDSGSTRVVDLKTSTGDIGMELN